MALRYSKHQCTIRNGDRRKVTPHRNVSVYVRSSSLDSIISTSLRWHPLPGCSVVVGALFFAMEARIDRE